MFIKIETKSERRSFPPVLTKVFLLSIILIAAGTSRVYSQISDGRLSLVELYPGGRAPVVPSNVLTHSFTCAAIDTLHDLVYVKLDHKLWTYSISKNHWLKPDSLPIDYNLNDMAYDPGFHRLLFWDRGVGRVYARSDSGGFRRLDHSFNQRNQFGHLGWFDPDTHRIYAFGGYGLFTSKNIVTYYDPSAREWFLLDITDPQKAPAKQMAAMGTIDTQDNKLFMLASAQNKREGLWTLSLSSKSWDLIGYLNPNIEKYTSKNFTFNYWYNSYIPSQHLAFFSAVDLKHQDEIRLLSLDTQTDKLAFLPLQSQALPSGVDCINIIWLKKSHSLLLVLWKFMPTQSNYEATFYKISIKNLSDLKKYVNTHNDHLLSHPPRISHSDLNHILYLGIGCFLGIFLMFVLQFPQKRKRQRQASDSDGENTKEVSLSEIKTTKSGQADAPEDAGSGLTIILSTPIRFNYREKDITNDLPVYENKLLSLLANHMLSTNSFVLTDEIDNTLWHNHTSPDYVRKARNKTIERLETTLQRIAPLEDDQSYIIRRSYVYDNRKAEFGLNPDVCQVINNQT